MLHVEWYHICWPRLTAKRVEPVVSISWASCFDMDHWSDTNKWLNARISRNVWSTLTLVTSIHFQIPVPTERPTPLRLPLCSIADIWIFARAIIMVGFRFCSIYLRAVGRKVLWSAACVCLSVCLSVCAHCFCPQDISRTGSWITTKFGVWEHGVNL